MSSKPEVRGHASEHYDGRYRLYTVNHVPYGTYPRYVDGGPAMVVVDGWGKSVSSLCRIFSSQSVIEADDRQHTLSLRRAGGLHSLNGTKYPTSEAADQAAYEVGATAYMVYERNAREGPEPVPCTACEADLYYEPRVGWVNVDSGDDGGTYDRCPVGGHHTITSKGATP